MTKTRIQDLLTALTLEEKVSLLSGEDFWTLPAIDRLGMGKLRVTDGPNGARGGGSLVGGVTAAAFPVGISLGSTWDPELVQDVAGAIAQEVKSKSAHVALAPTVNIQRSVANGRNFECYSEDPELSAQLTVAYVTGLQNQGVSATLKHFVGNESEIERTTISSEIDERSLRETYLRPFEDAVKKANAWGIMSSYNQLNGVYTSENDWLLTAVLRQDWGYDGIVMSDWFGSHSTAESVNAGLDLEMPGATRDRGEKLVEAVKRGEVSETTLNDRVLAILRLMERTGALDDHSDFIELADDRPEHRALIRKAGAAGSVLLKNAGLLPLSKDIKKIAIIGPNAKVAQIMGGGSAQLNPHYRITPFEGIQTRANGAEVRFAQGCSNHRWEPMLETDTHVTYFGNTSHTGDVVFTETLGQSMAFWNPPIADGAVDLHNFSARLRTTVTADKTGPHRFGLHNAGFAKLFVNDQLLIDGETQWIKGRTFFEEGNDELTADLDLVAGATYTITVDFKSKPNDNLNVQAVRFGVSPIYTDHDIAVAVEEARAADVAILCVGRNGEWDTEGSDLLDITLPGRQDELIAAVLEANPNTVVVLQTGGPVEMPWLEQADTVLQAWYPGQEVGNSIADILFGDVEPTGRLAQTFPIRWQDNPTHSQDPVVYPGHDGKVQYKEGLLTGHRHYDAHGITPMFPFGYGLGYTEFTLSNLSVTSQDIGATVSLTLTNTGEREGTTVVQIYVGDDEASVDRPIRELKSFAKVTVPAGGRQEVTLDLDDRAFAYFDVAQQNWRIEEGRFTIWAGLNATDLSLSASLEKSEKRLPV